MVNAKNRVAARVAGSWEQHHEFPTRYGLSTRLDPAEAVAERSASYHSPHRTSPAQGTTSPLRVTLHSRVSLSSCWFPRH